MRVLHWIALCVLTKTVLVVGDYSLQFILSSFSNPEERNAADNCCTNSSIPEEEVCPGACNTTIWICVQDVDTHPDDRSCPLGNGRIPYAKSIRSLSIPSKKAWPGSIQLDVLAVDDHSETLGALAPDSPVPVGILIDAVFISNVSIAASDPPSLVMNYGGYFDRISVGLSFQVTCAVNFFGPDCNSVCDSRDDVLGHFTCDPVSGDMVCLPGYQNLAANCTECIPLNGCSKVGGFCEAPGECLCKDNYVGHLCNRVEGIRYRPDLE